MNPIVYKQHKFPRQHKVLQVFIPSGLSCQNNMAASSTLPDSFYQDFGINQHAFHQAFEDIGNGVFRLRPGWSLAFTHAVLTTGDRPTTVATVQGQHMHGSSAGELWRRCTGNSVTTETCCVYNCPTRIVHQTILKMQAPQRMSTLRSKVHSMIFAS